MIKLKSCPFCESSRVVTGHYMLPKGYEKGYVRCTSCNVFLAADTNKKAIKLWNTRVNEDQTKDKTKVKPKISKLLFISRI